MLGTSKNKLFISFAIIALGELSVTAAVHALELNTPALQSPVSGTSISGSSVTLKWFFVDFTNYYQVQIALDQACTQVILNKSGIDDAINQFVYTGLPQDGTRFYWRVKATWDNTGVCQSSSPCSSWSSVWSFISASTVVTPEPHPADTNADWRLIMGEVVPYIGGWQQGDNPMAYAIRGASLWQNGEYYAFNTSLSCPLCWVLDKRGTEVKSEPDAALHNVARSIAGSRVSLTVTPAGGTAVWGVEEYVPSALIATEITGSNGAWDTVNRKVSWWGTGDMPVVLRYQVGGADGSYPMQGAANVDGAEVAITGDTAVRLGNILQEGEAVPEGEGETVVEGEGEVLFGAEGEASVEGEASLADEDDSEGAGCCSPQRGKDLFREHLGNWLLFALTCLVLVRMGRIG